MTHPTPAHTPGERGVSIACDAHRRYGQRDNRETEGYDAGLAEYAADEIEAACSELQADNARLREALGKLEGNDEHPENRCERCGGRNICWFTASEIWNAHSDGANILCPICFVAAAESAGISHSAWQLIPERGKA